MLFDRLTDANFYWSLTGPSGEVVARHASYDQGYVNDYYYAQYYGPGYSGDRVFNGLDHLALAAGGYTLSVDLDGAATASLPYRLISEASAQTLLAGAITSGSLDQARGSSLFKVSLSQGDHVYLDGRSLTGGSIVWRLIDPYGVRVNWSPLAAAKDQFTVDATGDYWLVLDGGITNAADATVNYQFVFNKVPDVAKILVVGTPTAGTIDLAGQATVYSFDLAAATQLVFDAQTNRSDLLWSLTGPRGSEVTDRRFDQSDAANGLSVLPLPAGHYELRVRGSASATGAFSFNLLDRSAAVALALGTSVSGTLSPGNAALTYSFVAAAGDLVAFQSNSVGAGNATWRLLDRFGRDVAGINNLATNHAALSLAVAGTYSLLVEGRLDGATPIDFDVQLNAAGNQAPTVLPAGDALTIGSVVAGNLLSTSATQTYRFTLTSDSQLAMDNQSNINPYALWTLVGPRGTEVNQRYFYASDANYANPMLNLPAGEYALTISNNGNGGAYTFRLLDAAAFPSLTLDQQTSATRSLPTPPLAMV